MTASEIEVTVKTHYLADQSSPEYDFYLWSYEITITNHSDQMVQLLNRFWKITDMNSHIEEIDGPGVVGLQPVIKPGKSFSYNSFCQLTAPQGTMTGHYELQNVMDEQHFKISIPEFSLTSPSVTKDKLH